MNKWYLVQCRPRQEARAEENLLRQGYVCYRPQHLVEKVVRGRRKAVAESLFPGYVFIQLGACGSWVTLRSTRGVAALVSFGGRPAQVCPELIELLRQREQAEIDVEVPVFAEGERLRVTEGPFADLEVIYAGMDGEERAVVLLTLLQREQRLRMPLKVLKSAG